MKAQAMGVSGKVRPSEACSRHAILVAGCQKRNNRIKQCREVCGSSLMALKTGLDSPSKFLGPCPCDKSCHKVLQISRNAGASSMLAIGRQGQEVRLSGHLRGQLPPAWTAQRASPTLMPVAHACQLESGRNTHQLGQPKLTVVSCLPCRPPH